MRTPLLVGWIGLVEALLMTFGSEAVAQSFQGGLRGAVRDAQGVIPGVMVTS